MEDSILSLRATRIKNTHDRSSQIFNFRHKTKVEILFQGIGVLVGYNFAMTYYLTQYGIEIRLITSPFSYLMGGFYYHIKNPLKLRTFFIFPLNNHTLNSWIYDFYSKMANKSSVLHLNQPNGSLTERLLKVRKPKMFTLHGKSLSTSPKGLSVLKKIINNVDVLVVPSYDTAKCMHETTGYNPVVIHSGVDTRIFNDGFSKNWSRKKLKLPLRKKIVLWNARISPEKDLETLIKAIPMVVKDQKDVIFIIKGRAIVKPYYARFYKIYKKIEESMGTSNNLIWFDLGWTPYTVMPYLYRAADVFVHTSLTEGFGLVMAEAMSCGTPVVAANVATAPEVVGAAGLLFKPRDPEDLAEKLIRVLGDDRLRTKLSSKGVKRIREKSLTWDNAAKEYRKLYQSLL